MAATATIDTIGLLTTAKMSTEAVAQAVYLAAQQRQKIAVRGVVSYKELPPGSDFYLTTLGNETVQTLFSRLTTDGTTYSDTTYEGQDITFTPIDDSPKRMMQKFQYTGMEYSKVAWNRMSLAQKQAYVNGRIIQGGRALARAKDSSVLSLANPGLVPSANQINVGSPADFGVTNIGEIYEIVAENFGDGQVITLILPTSQIPIVDAITRLRPVPNASMTGGADMNLIYSDGNALRIMFHADVYDDASDGEHGIFFVEDAIAFQDIVPDTVDEGYDGLKKRFWASPEADYAYYFQDSSLAGTIQVPRT